ncbi:caspase family protein [Pedobacter paludis]|uniref:Peptidase C14 caspase domain-containing protein n=1 Tax=Pedobacter paludis TaxID=2203212 RepID=A0A317F630_9SPHI|nr:caspase family protein [Pedobacter paludis]PWS33359.1 hypothetical protein DF947_01665 [Pedobacter paludis]
MDLIVEKSYAALFGVGQRAGDSEGMAVTKNDAKQLSKALVSACDFPRENIALLSDTNASKVGILGKLDELIEKTIQEEADLTIIFFSGHGVIIGNEGYLIANDSLNENITATAISKTEFSLKLKAIKTRKMVVFLDCCHAGIFAKSHTPLRSADIDVRGSNRVIICASHHAQLSLLSIPVSLFSFAIIEGLSGKYLKENDQDIELFSLAMYIRERVATLSDAKQQPEIDLIDGGSTSNFILATHPSGYNRRFFDEDFQLWEAHKNLLDLDAPVRIDEAYRNNFNINNGLFIKKQVANVINNYSGSQNMTNDVLSIANITSIGDTHISLNIGGEDVKIQNSLQSLQSELGKRKVEQLQTANIIYNIGAINHTSFDMIQGRKVFNFELIKAIINTLSAHNQDIKTFRGAAEKHSLDWERADQIRRVALGHIENSFIGIIRVQLRKLFAIGFEPMSEVKLEKYINQCNQLVNAIIRLFNFILIKTLCEAVQKNATKLTQEEMAILEPFYNAFFERSAEENYLTFKGLINICRLHQIQPAMDELMRFANGNTDKAFHNLELLKQKGVHSDGNDALYKFTDCASAEASIIKVFDGLGFLINYKMVVINGVAYEEAYRQQQFYVHKYSVLETDTLQKANKISYESKPIPSNAIIIYKGTYQLGINLFPFVIDLNSLTEEEYPKLYVFVHMGEVQDMLTYKFIEGEQLYQISGSKRQRTIKELNEEMTDADKRKLYKHDRIFEIFSDDKSTLI